MDRRRGTTGGGPWRPRYDGGSSGSRRTRRGRYTGIHHEVYHPAMARTNIEIDDVLVAKVMRRYGLASKRAAVDLALRRLAAEPLSRDEALALEGSGWHGDLEEMRGGR